MPKPRSIDPSFWDDPDIATLSRDERLLLIGMITSCADDEGRLLADPGYLRKRVFGYDDDVSKQDVQAWRDNVCAKCRNVKLYSAEGQAYLCFLNWQEYQSIRYVITSKLPAYTEDSEELLSNKEDCGKLPQSSVNSPRVVLSSVEKGSVVKPSADAEERAPIQDKGPTVDEQFEQFWQAYPRRDGVRRGSKADALVVFKKMRPIERAITLQQVSVYARLESTRRDNGKYIPDAERWLREKRWETVEEEAQAERAKQTGVLGYGTNQGHPQKNGATTPDGRRLLTLGEAVAEHIAKAKGA